MQEITVGFIGGGNMARSLIKGLISTGKLASTVFASDNDPEKLAELVEESAIGGCSSNQQLIERSDIVILAVKPQVLKIVCAEIREATAKKRPLIISIAAGIQLESLYRWLGSDLPVVRVMPNTPALVGCGASALFAGEQVSVDQRQWAEQVLASVGLALWVDNEPQLDAVTALSGSGPAYFFLMLEALEASAVELGLSAEVARQLAIQTALGSAQLAKQSHQAPALLRQQVTSPGGTTAEGIKAMQEGHFSAVIDSAVTAAYQRSITLASELGE